ncbi:unnamed protein product, partial [Caretta caretta]
MAPKCKPNSSSGAQPKKHRSVPTLEKKLAVLDLLRNGMSVSNMARKYDRNKSSIHAIKIREREIHQAVASGIPMTAKVTSQVHDKTLLKTEKALNLWLEDMNRKRVPIDGNIVREKALSLYALFKPPTEEGKPSDEKEFKASQGWLNSFRNHFNLKNVQTTGEAASANEEAAKAYPKQLKKIIKEKGYLAEQVFNADETGLFWKEMPNRTYTSKSERQAPGFKAAKDRGLATFGTWPARVSPLAGQASMFTCCVCRFGRSQLPLAAVSCSRPMGTAGSGSQHIPRPAPLPTAPIGLEQRTAASRSC